MADKDNKLTAWEIVEKMMERDAFSKWMDIELVVIEAGYAKIKMEVRDDMLNGFGIAHGGIAYSLADSALAFASNAQGQIALSTNTFITHFKSVNSGDVLTAETREYNIRERIAHYQVVVSNQNNEQVAVFGGSVYRTSKVWSQQE